MKRTAAFLVVLSLLPSCVSDYAGRASVRASEAGFKQQLVFTKDFTLTSYVKKKEGSNTWNVYIEGDGMAWRSHYEPSLDPTPRKAVGLTLAMADQTANVAYIARPCQYTPFEQSPSCNVSYWTNKRFAEEVINSTNEAIDKLTMSNSSNRKLNLIGYSGGGAVAVLVAARRDDISSIRTVAGNLDHEEVNRLNDASPLIGSLNAIDEAKAVSNIPQIHFSGAGDEIVPPSIAERFRAAAPTSCVATRKITGVSHENGWKETWPDLLKIEPKCE